MSPCSLRSCRNARFRYRKVHLVQVSVSQGPPRPGGAPHTTEDVKIKFDDILDTTETGVFGAYTWASDAMALVVGNGTNATNATLTNTTGINRTQRPEGAPAPIAEGAPAPQLGRTGIFSESANQGAVPKGTVNLQVVATSPTDATNPTEEQIAFSFIGDGAKSSPDIYWDPEAGVGYASGSAAGGAMLFSSA